MIIANTVKNLFPLLASLHNPQIAQNPQLMGNRRLTAPYQYSQVTYAQLSLQQIIQNLHSGIVAKHLEQLCCLLALRLIYFPRLQLF